jgi:GrpB-like predicted nucleotidyltransferase (UPF0157 family)
MGIYGKQENNRQPLQLEWQICFCELSEGLWCQLKGLACAIEHVGSTSVPGLAANPFWMWMW